MLKRILLFFTFWITFLIPKLFFAQGLPTFSCPVTIGLLNEGPNEPEHDSYITIITPSTGFMGAQMTVTDIITGIPYKSLNGIGIVNTDNYAYAQYQRVPTETEIITGLLAGNYTAVSSLIQIGSNGTAKTIGSFSPPVNTGYNAHVVLGLLGTSDNSGNYLVTAIEAQVDPITRMVSSYKLYIGKIAVPSATVTWSPITLDANCTTFIDAVLAKLRTGQDGGAQDMVWDFNTNKLFVYAGIDKVLTVINLNTNTSSCYADNNGVQATANLGGLALDSIGQMIGLEVQTGRVLRIDTRGCIDGNPATPCINSVTAINNYAINGNFDTRGDAASCVSACTPPIITKSDVIICANKQTTIDINVTGATNPYKYIWGIYPNNGTISNTTSQDVSYISNAPGNYKVYVTVSDTIGCQATDSINIQVKTQDTTKITATLCAGDSITFGSTNITRPGVYTRTIPSQISCDSIIQLTVNIGTNCTTLPTFTCPITIGLLNEGPNQPEHDSYITIISPSTGDVGAQIAVTDISTGFPYKSLNGVAILNTDGYAYAQYQAVPTETEILTGLLAGNYTATSSLIQIGNNGKAQTLGTFSPPVNTGFNAHVVLGLLGTADNSSNYLVTALEAQVDPITRIISSYIFYVGKIAVPNTNVTWSAIALDANCTTFVDAVLANLRVGQDGGVQDMVWDFNTNKLLLYSGIDKVLAVINLNNNTSSCYIDNNGVQATANLGGLALDSIGQMIGLEVQTGKVIRIDTRGCIDGNPATPCINSVTAINNYTINGNFDTRGDAASCVAACAAPTITKSNTIVCVNTPKQLSVNLAPQGNYTYVWGIYAGNGTLINSTASTPIYTNSIEGNYKVYVTVENATGCQATDSFIVRVVGKPDTTFLNQQLCSNKDDSIIFNGQIIKDAGTYLVLLPSFAGCDSFVKLVVTENVCNTNPPVAVKDDTITFGTTIIIDVLNNDYDVDGDSIFLCGIITQPTHGTATANQDGTITYTPNITSGVDSFQYQICSADGDSTAWVIISVEDCVIPNTFSPNGDGKNDVFEIPCVDGKDGNLLVFNRWGAQVFKNEHYDNVTGLFDGKFKGEDLPDGTYYYVLKYNSLQGKKIDKSGFIVIHRSSN